LDISEAIVSTERDTREDRSEKERRWRKNNKRAQESTERDTGEDRSEQACTWQKKNKIAQRERHAH
jgi:hypothetical protein